MRTYTSTIAWRRLMPKRGSACCKSMERMCRKIANKTSSAHASRWSSICRGATLWGLEHSELRKVTAAVSNNPTITSRLSRYSYGLTYSEPYDSSKHLIQDRFYDEIEGIYRAAHQMEWLLKRVRDLSPALPRQTKMPKG